jgi:HEAT repeat protein/beta-lactamase regulating signal transducer with metallopeptidase domain
VNDTLSTVVLAWLLTYAIHSTVLLGLAWVIARRRAVSPAARDFIWKVAIVGAVLTASLQLRLGLRPLGSVSLARSQAGPAALAASAASQGVSPHDDRVPPDVSAAPPDPSPLSSPLVPPGNASLSDGSAAPDSAPARGWAVASIGVITWASVALLFAGAYAVRRLILAGRLTDRRTLTEGSVPAMLESLRAAAGHRGRVRLSTATTISSPVALGFAEICIPLSALTDLDVEQQRGLLAHELAHLIRRDPLWLAGASLLERVFFFQPLNRLARRELQQAAEYLCDDWAADRTGSGLPLAKCLARVAEWIQASPLGVPVAGMAEQRSLLVSRIARLIEGRAPGSAMPRRALAGVAVVLLSAIVAAAPGVQGSPPVPRAPVRDSASRPSIARPVVNAGDLARTGAVLAREKVQLGALRGKLADGVAPPASEDTAVVIALIERLKDTDAGVRRAAAGSLGNLRSRRAVPALIAVCDDKNADVRAAAVEALGAIKDDRAIHALTLRIGDPSPDVREHALESLSAFAHQVPAEPVIGALKDARASVRGKSAELLGEIGDKAAVGPLSRLIKDPSADVRERAIRALESIKDPSAEPSLRAALADENADVRVSALRALRELKVAIAERTILDALNDSSPEMRQEAARIAGDGPFPNAVAALRRALDDSVSEVREAAVDALSQIRGPAARDALRAALKSSNAAVRRRATEALGERP